MACFTCLAWFKGESGMMSLLNTIHLFINLHRVSRLETRVLKHEAKLIRDRKALQDCTRDIIQRFEDLKLKGVSSDNCIYDNGRALPMRVDNSL
jgi:hypothetical protein